MTKKIIINVHYSIYIKLILKKNKYEQSYKQKHNSLLFKNAPLKLT